jgi:hypothetical protein
MMGDQTRRPIREEKCLACSLRLKSTVLDRTQCEPLHTVWNVRIRAESPHLWTSTYCDSKVPSTSSVSQIAPHCQHPNPNTVDKSTHPLLLTFSKGLRHASGYHG